MKTAGNQRNHVHQCLGRLSAFFRKITDFFEGQDMLSITSVCGCTHLGPFQMKKKRPGIKAFRDVFVFPLTALSDCFCTPAIWWCQEGKLRRKSCDAALQK